MKALNLLVELREVDYREFGASKEDLKVYDEAIEELEEAMKPKTCEGCKQSWEPNNQTFHKYFCEYLRIPVHGDFYCNRYKPKDNA